MAVRPEPTSSRDVGPGRLVLVRLVARRAVATAGDGGLDHHLAVGQARQGQIGLTPPAVGSTHSVGTVGTPARSRSRR